jgi:hypothetical protein
MRSKLVPFYWILVSVVLISSCAVSTKVKSSAIQELSSNFNVLYHGEASLRQALETLDNQEEDYEKQLSFIPPSLRAGARDSSVFDLVERAETKAVKVIQKHSIYLNNTEYNKHIPRAYNLLGMSRLISGRSFEALESFEKAKTLSNTKADREKAILGLALGYYHLGESEAAIRQLFTIEKTASDQQLSADVSLLQLELFKEIDSDRLEIFLDQAINDRKALSRYTMRTIYAMAQYYESVDKNERANGLYRYLSKKTGYERARFRILSQLRLAQLTTNDSAGYFEQLTKIENRWNNYDQRYYVDVNRGRWLLEQSSFQADQKKAQTLDSLAVAAFECSNLIASDRVKAINYDYLANHFLSTKNYQRAFAYFDTLVTKFSAGVLRSPSASKELHRKLFTYLNFITDLKALDSVLDAEELIADIDQDEILTLMPAAQKQGARLLTSSTRVEQFDKKIDLTFEAASMLAYDFEDFSGARALLTPLIAPFFAEEVRAAALFRLQQISVLFEQTTEAEAYKNRLIEAHPNSMYTLYVDGVEQNNEALEHQLARLFSESHYAQAYILVERAYSEKKPLRPESLLIAAVIEARLYGIDAYTKRLKEIKQVFRNTWADREASRMLVQSANQENLDLSNANRYAVVVSADTATLEKLQKVSAQKLKEQNYDLSAVIEPFNRNTFYLVVGWFSTEAYAEAFYKRNASVLKTAAHTIISQDNYLSAQLSKRALF